MSLKEIAGKAGLIAFGTSVIVSSSEDALASKDNNPNEPGSSETSHVLDLGVVEDSLEKARVVIHKSPDFFEQQQQETQPTIIGVPSVELTEEEKIKFQEIFVTSEAEYAGIIPNLEFDESGKFLNLPFEKGSQAETLVQDLGDLALDITNFGGFPELVIAVNLENNLIATAIRTTKEFTIEGNTFSPGTFFFKDQVKSHYLEFTPRPGGENDRIQLIRVTPELRALVSQYQLGKQKIAIAGTAEWILGQVSEDGTVVSLISQDLAVFFVEPGELGSQTPATLIPGITPEPIKTKIVQDILVGHNPELVAYPYTISSNIELGEEEGKFTSVLEFEDLNQNHWTIGIHESLLGNIKIESFDKDAFMTHLERMGVDINHDIEVYYINIQKYSEEEYPQRILHVYERHGSPILIVLDAEEKDDKKIYRIFQSNSYISGLSDEASRQLSTVFTFYIFRVIYADYTGTTPSSIDFNKILIPDDFDQEKKWQQGGEIDPLQDIMVRRGEILQDSLISTNKWRRERGMPEFVPVDFSKNTHPS